MIAKILETLDFADPVRLNTKYGLRMVRKSPLSLDFWGAWNMLSDSEKAAFKKAGFSLGKYREVWEMSWWSDKNLRFHQPDIAGAPAPEPEPEPVVDLDPLRIPDNLFPYQVDSVRRGVATMSKYGRVLLGHGTGMGKTAIALAIARERGRKVAVICPKSITTDWHRLAKYLGVEVYEAVGWEWVKTGKSRIGNWQDREKKRFVYTLPEDCDLVLDEVHKCFPHATLVETDKGPMRIGDIMQSPLDIRILSFNFQTYEREFKPVTHRFKFPAEQLVLVKHERGEFVCTPDHRIWCHERQDYVEAGRAQGCLLQTLPSGDDILRDKNILFSQMPIRIQEVPSEDADSLQLQKLRGGHGCRDEGKDAPILQPKLCGIRSPQESRIQEKVLGDIPIGRSEGEELKDYDEESSRPKFQASPIGFEKNDGRQSFLESRNSGKDVRQVEGQNILGKGRQRNDYGSTAKACRSIGVGDGVCHTLQQGSVPLPAEVLQGGHRQSRSEDCNRGGRKHSQDEEMEVSRCKKDRDIELSRVVSVEVLEQGSQRRLESLCGKGEAVYCIEVEGNHNFYADGVLVSNCKAPGATQNSLLLRDAVDQKLPCIALSATIASDPTQLWAMGMFLGLHSGGADYYRFLSRNGCYKTQWGMQFRGGKPILKKLHSQIFPERGNRLRPIDAGDAFPETLIAARAFDMDSAKDIANEYDELSARIEELRMSENFMADKLAAITKARMRIELLKAPSLASLAKDLIEEGNSVFIAVNFTETREFLMEELKTKCAIYGGQKDMDRRGAIDSFQRDDSRVLIGIIQACREGISLHDTKGEYPRVALISPTYSALDLIQVLGRVHRAGGKSKSIQYIAYCSGVPVEERICKKLNEKMANLSSIMDGDLDTAVYLDTEKV